MRTWKLWAFILGLSTSRILYAGDGVIKKGENLYFAGSSAVSVEVEDNWDYLPGGDYDYIVVTVGDVQKKIKLRALCNRTHGTDFVVYLHSSQYQEIASVLQEQLNHMEEPIVVDFSKWKTELTAHELRNFSGNSDPSRVEVILTYYTSNGNSIFVTPESYLKPLEFRKLNAEELLARCKSEKQRLESLVLDAPSPEADSTEIKRLIETQDGYIRKASAELAEITQRIQTEKSELASLAAGEEER